MEASTPPVPVRTVEPPSRWPRPRLREIWEHRDLVYFMARRDVAVRYKQALVGAFWALLQPLLLAGVFALFFGVLQKVDAPEGIPYPLFAVSGMVMWLFISNAVQAISESTVTAAPMISKVYFPRLIVPLASVAPAAADFAVGFIVVVVLAAAYGFWPNLAILALPLVFGLAMLAVLGFGFWLSALNVKYRDVHLAVPFLILVGLFISPIIYPLEEYVPEAWQPVYAINPFVGVLELFRWIVIGTPFPDWYLVVIPVAVSVAAVISGLFYFVRAEQSFADDI